MVQSLSRTYRASNMNHRPSTIIDLERLFVETAARKGQLELRGGGSKAAIGAPRPAEIVDLNEFTGIVDYDPSELVLTVRPGTKLTDVEALLEGQ